jgi:AcrR family transcriptional regulator
LWYERTIVRYLELEIRSVKPLSKTEQPIHPRKVEIMEAAVMCFLERGYHQTGVRDIARQAGVSLGNLYNHFKGKEAILAFIAEIEGAELAGFIELLTKPANPQDALEQFIDEYAAYASLPENALLGVEILTEATRNATIADVFGKNRSRLIDAIVSCLREGANTGAFTSYDGERAVACLCLDVLEGHGLRSLSKSNYDPSAMQNLKAFLVNGLKP